MTDQESLFNIIQSIILIEFSISYLLGALCFLKYGRLLVKLLDESAIILGLKDKINSVNSENYRTCLTKLRVVNLSLSITACWLGLVAFFVAFFRNRLSQFAVCQIILAVVTFDVTAMIKLITLLGIIYG
ncbi:23388_t:CDS:2, partial [Racocetra persica]